MSQSVSTSLRYPPGTGARTGRASGGPWANPETRGPFGRGTGRMPL